MINLVTVAMYFCLQAFGEEPSQAQALVTVKGQLICDLGSQNTGQPCSLVIQEEGSGRVYLLAGSDSAMRLYFGGTRRASVEGSRSSDSITVKTISAL